MALARRTIALSGDEHASPWSTALDAVEAIDDPQAWVLVGGLMVEVHTRAAGVIRNRSTSDVNVVVDIAGRRQTLQQTYGALAQAGFALEETPAGRSNYRMRRDTDVIDLMVAANLPSALRQRLAGRPAFSVEGASQAIDRAETWAIESDRGTHAIRVPNLLAAMVAKSIAFSVDQRQPGRHLDDIVALLAAASGSDLDQFRMTSRRDRQRLRPVITALGDPTIDAWFDVDPPFTERARRNLARVTNLMEAS